MSTASINRVPDASNTRQWPPGYHTEILPCSECGAPRAVRGVGQAYFTAALRNRCRSCATKLAARTQWANRISGTEDYDWVAVERLMAGDQPDRVSRADRLEAVAQLTARGVSVARIAELLHITTRSVERRRALLRARTAYQQDEVA